MGNELKSALCSSGLLKVTVGASLTRDRGGEGCVLVQPFVYLGIL